jgi:replicative DNA helicase
MFLTGDFEVARSQLKYESANNFSGGPNGQLSALIQSWKPGMLVTIASRPSFGKTTMALQMATAVARRGQSVIFLTDSPIARAWQLLASCASVPILELEYAALSHRGRTRVSRALQELGKLPFFLGSSAGHGIDSIVQFRADLQNGAIGQGLPKLGLVVLDGAGAKQGDLGNAAHTSVDNTLPIQLKMIAAQMQCVTLITASIKRRVETRKNHRPTLADLNFSNRLEKFSDAVYGLYRDEIYSPYSLDAGLAELLCLKPQLGKRSGIRLFFESSIPRFFDMSQVRQILRGRSLGNRDRIYGQFCVRSDR